jgi:8-oxo-dGTP diphosphatase
MWFLSMLHENTFRKVDFSASQGLLFVGSKILLYRRDKNTTSFPLHLDLPGGGRENDETPFETFQREVKEELGVSISADNLQFSCAYVNTKEPGKTSYFFVSRPLSLDESAIMLGDDGVEWLLMTPEEFVVREDAIPHQQKRVIKYLTGSLGPY